jgi:hypothetical protein
MWTWIAAAGIAGTLSIAHAAVPAPVLLSRFPAGEVPATDEVLGAIGELAAHPENESVPLLRSLSRLEQGEVAEAARTALEATQTRLAWREQAAARESFRHRLPSGRDLGRWLGDQRRQGSVPTLATVGRAEQGAVAYAALVLGGPELSAPASPPPGLQVPDDEASMALVADGLALEAEERMHEAVAAYAKAAAGGRAEAVVALERLGVDVDRLLLGMTSPVEVAGLPQLPPEQVQTLVRHGSADSVAVLIERARDQQGLDRLVALDALGNLIQSEALSPVQRRTVRGVLEQAAVHPRVEVRHLARTSLAPSSP